MQIRRLINKALGQLLIESGIITNDQLERALLVQKEKGGLLGQIMVDLGYITEKDIAQAITVQYGYAYLPLENYEFDKSIVSVIPANVARQYGLVAIDKLGDMLTIAMCNPLNVQAIEDIEMLTKCKVRVFVSTLTDIQKIITEFYPKAEPGTEEPGDDDEKDDKGAKA